MPTSDESHFSRLLVEWKLCTPSELELVLAEQKNLSAKGKNKSLRDLVLAHGYVTPSQIARLNHSLDDDSMYRPAQQIPGYQVLSKLGQGAMAVVFKARQLSLDRIVAIKVLPRRLSENQEFVDRFYKEGRAAAKLNHPHIVGAYDVGEAGGYHYFVMEYIDGETVYELVAKGRPMEEARAIQIALEVSQALEHSHAQGLIHRDVKPKNIMITKEGEVKLADMGLAREMGDYEAAQAEAGRAYGTPYYISPEQIRGSINIDTRADIYSLGATFYHMVTGKVPYEGPSPSAVMHKHLKEALLPPDHVNPKLSSGIGEIIEVMMAKNPDDRYPSMTEVIEDLKAVRRGEPPFHARQRYDQNLLEKLANTGEIVERSQIEAATQDTGQKVSVTWLILLAMLLILSVLGNIVQLAI
jgi:serine/threonine protein kinase